MSGKLHLKIITPEEVLVDTEIDEFYSKATDGDFGILEGHAPIMTALDYGITKYIKDNQVEYIATMGGICQVSDNKIILLSDVAEFGEHIDVARAKDAKRRAEERLAKETREIDVERAHIALMKANTRIRAASESKHM